MDSISPSRRFGVADGDGGLDDLSRRRLERLAGVLHQIDEHAGELLGVDPDRDVVRHVVAKRDLGVAGRRRRRSPIRRPARADRPARAWAACRSGGRSRAPTGRKPTALSIEWTSRGARRWILGSSSATTWSESNCAEVSVLRRSWLILATARPRSARCRRCRSIEKMSVSIAASSFSTMPISSLAVASAR